MRKENYVEWGEKIIKWFVEIDKEYSKEMKKGHQDSLSLSRAIIGPLFISSFLGMNDCK